MGSGQLELQAKTEAEREHEMKRTAIYCRVSTEDQAENYSIPTQREAISNYGTEHGMEIIAEFIDPGVSGSTLDRPALTELRELAKSGQIDAVVAYDPDRLSRNCVHLMVLANEFEQQGIELSFVTQDVGRTPEDKMLFGMKGLFAEYERTKIRERTMRGKRARALAGRLPSGTGRKLYGYDYVPGKGTGEGIRYRNEAEVRWVGQMYQWLVEEKLTVNGITRRLRELGVTTPTGAGFWGRQSVFRILTNPAYIGKTYAFTRDYVEPKTRNKENPRRKKTGVVWKPKEEWLEIPGVTPPIISQELFDAAQEQLKLNKTLSPRNSKREYLLSGHVFCGKCQRRYQGYVKKSKGYEQRYYRCGRSMTIVDPTPCRNQEWNAPKLEQAVWQEVEALLSKPQIALKALQVKAEEANQNDTLERELIQMNGQLRNREKQKARVWRAFELTGDEETFKANIAKITQETEALENQKLALERSIEVNNHYQVDLQSVEEACQLLVKNVQNLNYEEKRFVLNVLQVRVVVSGRKASLEGAIPLRDIVSSASISPTPRWPTPPP